MRSRPSPSTVLAIVAIIVASSGIAVAATQLAGNSVTTRHIKDRTILLRDLSRKTRRYLHGAVGPRGARGPTGEQGVTGPQGVDGVSLFNTATIPSGTTIRGVWGGRYIAAIAGNQQNSYLLTVGFPLPAPQKLRDSDVQFGAATAGPVGDADPACNGNVATPTAPPGKVCIYVNEGATGTRSNTTLTGFKLSAAGVNTDADAYGFEVRMVDAGTVPGTMRAEGTWAYTAP